MSIILMTTTLTENTTFQYIKLYMRKSMSLRYKLVYFIDLKSKNVKNSHIHNYIKLNGTVIGIHSNKVFKIRFNYFIQGTCMSNEFYFFLLWLATAFLTAPLH